VKRKVSLGTCGRAYGTPCSHEHACVRCGLLRVDPAQHERLVTVRDNLTERISEATDRGWLGEVEGLQVSLAAATAKLTKLVAQPATARPENARTVLLGPPSPANK
jgi:hypothetical protein